MQILNWNLSNVEVHQNAFLKFFWAISFSTVKQHFEHLIIQNLRVSRGFDADVYYLFTHQDGMY